MYGFFNNQLIHAHKLFTIHIKNCLIFLPTSRRSHALNRRHYHNHLSEEIHGIFSYYETNLVFILTSMN